MDHGDTDHGVTRVGFTRVILQSATVDGLPDQFSSLWVELALRADVVAPSGTLDPEWRAVFLRHPDRFMVGTDTWVTSRWEMLVDGMQTIRG